MKTRGLMFVRDTTLHLSLTFAYEDQRTPLGDVDVLCDARFLSEPWEEVVMFAAADDCIMGAAQAEELEVLFHDRAMGIVVYADKLVESIVTVHVQEKEMN